jgi:hypothetical protein
VLDVAVEITLEPVVEFNAVDGAHVYVIAPETVSVAPCPLQTEGLFDVRLGEALTVTVIVFVAIQPLEPVPVIV